VGACKAHQVSSAPAYIQLTSINCSKWDVIVCSANLVKLASGLPSPSDRWDIGYQ